MPHPQFDPSRLLVKPLDERQHGVRHDSLLGLDDVPPPLDDRAMQTVSLLGRRLEQARERRAPVLMMMGAHVIRAGVARQLIDLMERGLVTHVGTNGAGAIHDYELARIGATSERTSELNLAGQHPSLRIYNASVADMQENNCEVALKRSIEAIRIDREFTQALA